jgi:hypothetical protein
MILGHSFRADAGMNKLPIPTIKDVLIIKRFLSVLISVLYSLNANPIMLENGRKMVAYPTGAGIPAKKKVNGGKKLITMMIRFPIMNAKRLNVFVVKIKPDAPEIGTLAIAENNPAIQVFNPIKMDERL